MVKIWKTNRGSKTAWDDDFNTILPKLFENFQKQIIIVIKHVFHFHGRLPDFGHVYKNQHLMVKNEKTNRGSKTIGKMTLALYCQNYSKIFKNKNHSQKTCFLFPWPTARFWPSLQKSTFNGQKWKDKQGLKNGFWWWLKHYIAIINRKSSKIKILSRNIFFISMADCPLLAKFTKIKI